MDTTSLADMARAHIERARAAAHGRSAHTLHGGHDRVLRQTVIALRAGETLHEHDSSRDATLQVLAGRVRLTAAHADAGRRRGRPPHGARRGPHAPRGRGLRGPAHRRARARQRPSLPSLQRAVPARSTPGRRTGNRHAATDSRRNPDRRAAGSSLRIRMTARAVDEPHRVSTQLELLFDLTFVVAVAAHRDAARPRGGRGARGGGRRAVPAGVLRHLVGLDELHLVRLVLRHRRRPVPAAHPAADGRGARPGRRGAVRVRHRGLPHGHPRLPGDAGGPGRAVAAGGAGGPGEPRHRPPVRRRHHRRRGPLAPPPAAGRARCAHRRRRRWWCSWPWPWPSSPCPSGPSAAGA